MSQTTWIAITLASLLFYVLTSIIEKILRTNYIKDSLVMWVMWLLRNVVFFGFLPFITIEPITHFDLFLVVIAGVFWYLASYPYAVALSSEEVSRIVPVWHTAPLFTLLLSMLFLNEKLIPQQYLAFGFLVVGGILVSLHFHSRGKVNLVKLSPTFFLMVVSTILYAAAMVVLKYLLAKYNFIFIFVFLNITAFFMPLFLLPIKKIRTKLRGCVMSLTKSAILLFIIATLFTYTGLFLYNYAISLAPVSLVASLDGFQSLFLFILTVFLSWFFPKILKEDISRRVLLTKITALALMFIGLYLLYK